MCFVFQIPWENTMGYKKSMGEFHTMGKYHGLQKKTMGEFPWVKKKTNYYFSHITIIIINTHYYSLSHQTMVIWWKRWMATNFHLEHILLESCVWSWNFSLVA
jgi:hypothetical protein